MNPGPGRYRRSASRKEAGCLSFCIPSLALDPAGDRFARPHTVTRSRLLERHVAITTKGFIRQLSVG